MRYRDLGNTGLKVSEIGMGCEGFGENHCENTKLLFDVAEESGINYFDLYASDPEVRASVGRALAFASFPNISWYGHCMYCSHCAPCPKGIDVASVTKFLNLVRAQGEVWETVREHYELLSNHAGECIRCGACETRCPFGVEIMENMAEAKRTFGK